MGPTSDPGSLALSEGRVREALLNVHDPEIPVITLFDLGVINGVEVSGDRVKVDLLPTFLGCPALAQMTLEIESRIRELGLEPEIEINKTVGWSSDLISPRGREILRESGFAPPRSRSEGQVTLIQLQGPAECPYCGSMDTRLENLFGPTPCRSLRYCTSCRQPFEQFKTL